LSSGVPVPALRRIAIPNVAAPAWLAVTPPNSAGIPDTRLSLSMVNRNGGGETLVS
jgi:hypothetical protein